MIDLSKPLLTPWELAPKFFAAGVEHIMTGYDHLCFLIAVMLWATRIWPVVKIVTAFTVSHSVTLSLAALQLVNLPSHWVEIAIALSIIYVAVENFFTRKVDGRWRDTFAFGFIHGFGFASGLIELGVPQRAIVPALASFNIGVEVGTDRRRARRPPPASCDRQDFHQRAAQSAPGAGLLGDHRLLRRLLVLCARFRAGLGKLSRLCVRAELDRTASPKRCF